MEYDQLLELLGVRMGKAVPGLVERSILEPVGTREVDDDAAGGRFDRGCSLVVEADEEEVCPACERLVVRHERGRATGAVSRETWIEGARRLPGERVGAEREEVKLRMG